MSTNPPKKRPSTDTLVLLGSDPFRQTYHWEGPQPGTVWETAAGNLFGWLMRWTEPEEGEEVVDEDGRPIYYLVDPNTQECWVAKDGSGVVVVVDKTSGMEVLRIKMELAHWYKENLIGSLEELRGRTSPYAFAAAVMRGEVW